MKKILFGQLPILMGLVAQAQQVGSYSIHVDFFPEDAQMWGYPVSNDAFMRGFSKVELTELGTDALTFYLHGELKIDSIISGNNKIDYTSKKVFYGYDYSNIGLKTTIGASHLITDDIIEIHYSGFMNPSRARSLSDYMLINKEKGVYLRSYHYSPWFPIFEKPDQEDYMVDFKEITLRLPKTFKAIVTGELLDESVSGETYIARWKPGITEISNIQCTARAYEVMSQKNIFVHYVSEKHTGSEIIEFAESLKDLFTRHLKEVHNTSPLHIMEMPEYGNISSQNVIGISTKVYRNFNNELDSKLTIAHELVHPYVYIPVANSNPFHALVVEGFSNFFHLYGLEKTLDIEDFDLKKYMRRVEQAYRTKRHARRDSRGNPLPPEKPILGISYDEIGKYKDLFILPDRVPLFLYHLWNTMGDREYDMFLKELFHFDSIDYGKFEGLIIKYIPGYEDNLNTWLNTTDYPASIQIID